MRGVANESALLPVIEAFSRAQGLELAVHDDRDLPSLCVQLSMFRRARVVVAPHGAGESNIIAMSDAPGACLVEMLPFETPNVCFMRQALMLGMRYAAVRLDPPPAPAELAGALARCVPARPE